MNSRNEVSQRQLRYSEIIRQIVSTAIQKSFINNHDDELGPVTVSFVKMSKDLRIASIYIMPLGGLNKEKTLNLLNENKNFFQKEISKQKLRSKFTPKIKFFLDDVFDESQKIEKLLLNEKVIRDLK